MKKIIQMPARHFSKLVSDIGARVQYVYLNDYHCDAIRVLAYDLTYATYDQYGSDSPEAEWLYVVMRGTLNKDS